MENKVKMGRPSKEDKQRQRVEKEKREQDAWRGKHREVFIGCGEYVDQTL